LPVVGANGLCARDIRVIPPEEFTLHKTVLELSVIENESGFGLNLKTLFKMVVLPKVVM
jgi:hypothetical protein